MNSFEQSQSSSDYESSVEFFLDAANDALRKGHSGLATHLFCAAFEISQEKDYAPSEQVIEGLRTAWHLACEQGDRSMAETIFTNLVPYSSPEQTQDSMEKLQNLAIDQLEDMGLSRDDVENLADVIGQELIDNMGSEMLGGATLEDVMDQVRGLLLNSLPADGAQMASFATSIEERPMRSMNEDDDDVASTEVLNNSNDGIARRKQPEQNPSFDFSSLYGYSEALQEMRVYGFEGAGDDAYKEFVQEASRLHGIRGLMLHEPFLFYGPARQDVLLFAQATAGEIGRPVVSMHVEMDDSGTGSIKLSGPFKRSLFGNPDPTEFPSPCTFMIENVDMLEYIFEHEETEQLYIPPQQGVPQGASMRAEVTSYIHALMSRPGVFLIMTGSTADVSPVIRRAIGGYQAIEIDNPVLQERVDVWQRFAADHPSFQNLNFEELAVMSEGASRRDIFNVGRAAVKTAYRESLRNHAFRNVKMNDVLVALGSYIDHSSLIYHRLEDRAVNEFLSEIDTLLDDKPLLNDPSQSA